MACTAFTLQNGLFSTTHSFGTGGQSAGFSVRPKQGDPQIYEIVHNTIVIASSDRGAYNDGSVAWMLFPGNKTIAVRLVRQDLSSTSFRIDVWDVTNTSAPQQRFPQTGLLSGGSNPQMHCDPSLDGKAYMLWIGDGANQSHSHLVFRSDQHLASPICSYGPMAGTAQRTCTNNNGTIEIRLGGTVMNSCPLPQGSLDVSPSGCHNFGQVTTGSTATKTYTLKNDGADCLVINAVASSGPFAASASPSLPTSLNPNEQVTVTVAFVPTATGPTGETHLAVTRSPALGDAEICVKGTGVAPVPSLALTPSGLSFGTESVGSTSTGSLTIENDGQVAILVDVPGPSLSAFSWSAVANSTLNPGQSLVVNVAFTPTTEGSHVGTLVVNSIVAGSPHQVPLAGQGCVPNGVLSFPAGSYQNFGNVEVGYRSVRYRTVGNTGDGDATLLARIVDPAAGFGLADATGSITSSLQQRTWTVPPQSRCGPGGTGGPVTVAVNFHAVGTPGTRTTDLILEQLDGATVVTQRVYPLSAVVVEAVALDLAAVFDRSGSMGETTGARVKADAAIAAGQLLVQLMRPDIDDRVALIRFNVAPDVIQSITSVSTTTAPTQDQVAAKLDPTSLNPSGGTSIAGGVIVAQEELAQPHPSNPPTINKALVVLTDGQDNHAYLDPNTGNWFSVLGGLERVPGGGWPGNRVNTAPVPWPAGMKGYAVGIGSAENIAEAQLAALSTATGGEYHTVVTLAGEHYFALEKYFLQIFMDSVDVSLIWDPIFTIHPGEVHRRTFTILRGDVSGIVTIFDSPVRLPLRLISPQGEVLTADSAPAGFAVRSGTAPTARFIEFTVPQGDPHRYAGEWTVEVARTGREESDLQDDVGDNSLGLSAISVGHGSVLPVAYGLSAGAGSNLRLQPHVTAGGVTVGDSIALAAAFTEAGFPVNKAAVDVDARSPSGVVTNWILGDDGTADHGEYTALFDRTAEGGSYLFTFRAEGRSRDGEVVQREATISKYVEGRLPTGPIEDSTGGGEALNRCCAELARWIRVLGIGVAIIIVLLIILLLVG